MPYTKFFRGMAYFEFLLALSIIFIMVGVFFNRVLTVSAATEAANLNRNLSIIRTDLRMFTFQKMVEGQEASLLKYNGTNPMTLIRYAPVTYIKIPSASYENIPPGSWFYDAAMGNLIYKVVNTAQFYDGKRNTDQARYRLKFFFKDNDNNKQYNPKTDSVNGLTLVALGDYRWH